MTEVPQDDSLPTLHLALQDDGLRAVISTVHLRTTVAEIEALLEEQRITVGVSPRRVRNAVRSARRSKRPVRDVVVAEGRRPRAPSPRRVRQRIPSGQEALPELEPLQQLLAADREEVLRRAPNLIGWLVGPGAILADITQTPGEEGLSVRGESIPLPQAPEGLPEDPQLEPGPGVALSEDGSALVATVHGYAGLNGRQLCVIEPIWISPDMMQACFLSLELCEGSHRPASSELLALLEATGVVAGIDEAALDHLATLGPSQPLEPIAWGEHPQSAADLHPSFVEEWAFRTGSFREDGSVDYRERNLLPPTKQGDLLAECEAILEGRPGRTIFGVDQEGSGPALPIELVAGSNTQLSTETAWQQIHATCDGGVALTSTIARDKAGVIAGRAYHFSVLPVVHLSDVGYESGHVDFQGHVVVKGSVRSGFSVKAKGSIAVAGSIEAGCELQADGDISVQQGIVGRATRIRALGSVRARFVQEASIEGGADIAIGSYAHGARLKAGGRIVVEGLGGSSSRGGIVGGETWAMGGIVALNVGSARGGETRLFAGVSADDLDLYEKVQVIAARSAADLDRLVRAIGLREFTPNAVRELIARDPNRKDEIMATLRDIRQVQRSHDQHLRDEERLRLRIAAIARAAPVEVSGIAHAGSSIQIGIGQHTLAADRTGVLFGLTRAGDDIEIADLPA